MILQEAWRHISDLLDKGLSIIPVYDKPTKIGNITFPAKRPCEGWDEYKNIIVDKEFLYNRLEHFDTTAVAIVCGKVSGNLEVIDIDVKWYPGLEIEIFNDIKTLLPDVFNALRVHKTQSGGIHILYRILGSPTPGSKKISGRERTEEEKQKYLEEHKNREIKTIPPVHYVETKGEGGYAIAPPSLGYSVLRDVPIPTITFAERESLINICKNYNKLIKEPKVYKPTQKEIEYYDENPFFHFSRKADPVEVLEDIGWKFVKQRGIYLWFTRPGKDEGVSGSFNTETRCFFVFTSNSDLEEGRGYFLSNIIIQYKFDGDKSKAYKYFVDSGYGRIKPSVERKIIERKAFANKEDLPNNLSQDAKDSYKQFKEHLAELHPHGTFWATNENDTITINREKLYEISAKLGFRNYEEEVWRIENRYMLYKKSKREYYDTIKTYVQIEEDDLKERVLNSYEKFIKDNGEFTMHRLQILTDNEILFDTKEYSYKFYKDCWIRISASSVDKNSYDDIEKLIFASKIQERVYNPKPSIGRYIEFLSYAIDLNIKYNYIKKIIGFLSHDYKDSAMGYIVLLVEKCEDPKQGGGTGKNIFCNILNYTTTFISKPGDQANLNEKFLQSWNGERVLGLSDCPKDFNYSFLKEFVTGTSILKKLFKDEKIISVEKLPKIVCSTQWSYKITDGGLRRRIIPLEFTDFFTKTNGVDTFFGIYFPDGKVHNGFTDDDWSGYDWFITESIQEWLKSGLKLFPDSLSNTGWNKQFRQTYVDTIVNIIEHFWNKWVEQMYVNVEDFKQDLEFYYEENSISQHFRPSMAKINQAIAEYATYNNVYYEKDYVKAENGTTKRYRFFKRLTALDTKDDLPF